MEPKSTMEDAMLLIRAVQLHGSMSGGRCSDNLRVCKMNGRDLLRRWRRASLERKRRRREEGEPSSQSQKMRRAGSEEQPVWE
ncbi:unnamed protein product, partial [Vitis vinifera]